MSRLVVLLLVGLLAAHALASDRWRLLRLRSGGNSPRYRGDGRYDDYDDGRDGLLRNFNLDAGKLDDEVRDITCNKTGNAILIESTTKAAQKGHYQKTNITYSIENGHLVIELRSYTNKTSHKEDFKFQWKVAGLQEYVENNKTAGFQKGEDTAGTLWKFVNGSFTFSMQPDTQMGNVTVKNFQGQSTDKVFTIIGHVGASTYTTKNGNLSVSPSEQKFDIILDLTNFNYTKNHSRIALVGWLQTFSDVHTVLKDDAGKDVDHASNSSRSVQFGKDKSPAAFFKWAGNVTLQPGLVVDVITSKLVVDKDEHHDDDESNQAISFAFDAVHPLHIEWDPSVGVGAGALNGPPPGAPGGPDASSAAALSPLVSLMVALGVAVSLFSKQQ